MAMVTSPGWGPGQHALAYLQNLLEHGKRNVHGAALGCCVLLGILLEVVFRGRAGRASQHGSDLLDTLPLRMERAH